MKELKIADYAIRNRWMSAIDEGFTAVPNALLKYQSQLDISANELALLIHIMSFWWEPENKPYPSSALIAKRMATTQRTIERHMASLIKKGYVNRLVVDDKKCFDLSGLKTRLVDLVAEHGNENRRGVEAPSHRI